MTAKKTPRSRLQRNAKDAGFFCPGIDHKTGRVVLVAQKLTTYLSAQEARAFLDTFAQVVKTAERLQ